MASGRSGIFVFSTIQTDKRLCRAKDCQRSSWRDLGIYCDMHYMMIPHFINLASGRPNGPPKMSKSLIGNLDGLRLQHDRLIETLGVKTLIWRRFCWLLQIKIRMRLVYTHWIQSSISLGWGERLRLQKWRLLTLKPVRSLLTFPLTTITGQ